MFQYKKSVQALNFFAIKAEEDGVGLYKTNALKLIYLADKKHLRERLRTITGDNYKAMQMGPVANNTRDLIETQADDMEEESENIRYANEFIESKRETIDNKKIIITSKKDVDETVLSKTDIDALNNVWDTFKDIMSSRGKNLWEETHKYPEGIKFEERGIWTPIKEEELFSTTENDPLGEFSEESAELAKKIYQENKEAERALGIIE